jgi:hypothetical protein
VLEGPRRRSTPTLGARLHRQIIALTVHDLGGMLA